MINRLLSIIYILMNRGSVTARELAERFEVSVRTVYRDIDTLGMAGIPIYTTKGRNGGIHLTEQFVLDKMLVSKTEQQQILAALASLKETGAHEDAEILNKLGDFFKEKPENWVAIDFSDWSGRRKELFNQLKSSILNRHVIRFDYYGQYSGMSSRCVEPVQLLFKDYTWYVRAFCRTRQSMRLFKVLRMQRVTVLDEVFEPRKEPECLPEDELLMANTDAYEEILLWVDKKEAYRIYDRFEEEEIEVLPQGHFIIHMHYPMDDWVYGIILSFGSSAKVLEPESVRLEIRRRIVEMGQLYE